ncbi:MAG: gliding motility-associated C-terminal domain-containing protein [Reichenbachiella sp.]|uniref:T9SS type B sorting domain-containing protein n=1 Tax=Reichenbachiella sp. TaxID=2184521 RepID=UPI003299103E
MKDLIIFILIILSAPLTFAQQTTMGSNTTLNIKGNSSLYFSTDATFEGSLFNEGEVMIENASIFNGVVENSGLVQAIGGSTTTTSSLFFNRSNATFEVNGDAILDGSIENNGLVQVIGDAALEISSLFNNNSEAILDIGGNAALDGTVVNNGEILVSGASTSVINGSIDNNNDLTFGGDTENNGSVNNNGFINVVGNLGVFGTYSNADGATTLIEGNLDQVSPIVNNGVIEILGNAIFSGSFTNNNEITFMNSSSFEDAVFNSQKMYIGGNSNFTSELSNTGEIISFADAQLNFQNNKNLGNLSFSDVDEAIPITEVILESSADSILIDHLNININGKVTMPSTFVLIQTELNIEQGVLNTTNQDNFLVTGHINVNSANSSAPAYIEGKMLAVTSANSITFPMGINGFPNYLTLNSSTAGITVKVECKIPDLDSLFTDEQTMGLAPDVEWTLQSLSDSAEMNVSVDYSGVDFTNSANFINAREYDATLQSYDRSDSLFHALRTVESDHANIGTAVPTEGTIKTSNQIWITSKPTRFALGLSPVLTEPEVYVPNVFTPDADMNENRVFRPFIGGAIVNAINIIIFDSFNSEVYSSNQSGEDLDLESLGWDGNLKNGFEAPEGVYYYNISIEYKINDEVSDKYFNSGERDQTQTFSKLGSVMLVK